MRFLELFKQIELSLARENKADIAEKTRAERNEIERDFAKDWQEMVRLTSQRYGIVLESMAVIGKEDD